MYTAGRTLLKIDHVSLAYGDKPILRDVNAEILELDRSDGNGQVVGFLGPSGIGKTQLFRIISGLNKPTAGQIILDGGIPVQPGLVGVVAQNYPLFEHRTILSNLLLAAKRKHPADALDQVMAYLNEFELADKIHLYPVQLSGGQRQRVSIIQQILCSEHFLLMDEPFSGLDMVALEKVAALIQKVANLDKANTVIIVSHDITTVCSVSDHVWLLGRERDSTGAIIPGARIMKNFNLADEDICWHPDIITSPRFVEFVRGVKEDFRML